jgi:hypothetical protein
MTINPTKLSDDEKQDLAEWVESLPPALRTIAARYPMTSCYRHQEDPRWHYVIKGYDLHKETGVVSLQLVHGRDSSSPGIMTFGQPYEPLIPCNCGNWEWPTGEQIEERARHVARFADNQRTVKKGHVVQVDPEACRFGPVFVVVEDVEQWGINGYFITHTAGQKGFGTAYLRVKHGDYHQIGEAFWVHDDGDEDEAATDSRGTST